MSFKDNLLTLMNDNYADIQGNIANGRLSIEDYRYQAGVLEGLRIVNALIKNIEKAQNDTSSPRLVSTGEDAA